MVVLLLKWQAIYPVSSPFIIRLINADVAFTMDVYSHIIEGIQSDAMALLDKVLPVGIMALKIN
jgi:hypothetical protein